MERAGVFKVNQMSEISEEGRGIEPSFWEREREEVGGARGAVLPPHCDKKVGRRRRNGKRETSAHSPYS